MAGFILDQCGHDDAEAGENDCDADDEANQSDLSDMHADSCKYSPNEERRHVHKHTCL